MNEATLTAIHEAGHACISLALGHSVAHVEIDPATGQGMMRSDMGRRFSGDQDVENEIAIRLAGGIAELKYQFGPLAEFSELATATTDLRHARRYAKHLATKRGQPARYVLRDAQVRVSRLLDDPAVWAAVNRVAGGLLEFGALTGFECSQIFHAAQRAA